MAATTSVGVQTYAVEDLLFDPSARETKQAETSPSSGKTANAREVRLAKYEEKRLSNQPKPTGLGPIVTGGDKKTNRFILSEQTFKKNKVDSMQGTKKALDPIARSNWENVKDVAAKIVKKLADWVITVAKGSYKYLGLQYVVNKLAVSINPKVDMHFAKKAANTPERKLMLEGGDINDRKHIGLKEVLKNRGVENTGSANFVDESMLLVGENDLSLEQVKNRETRQSAVDRLEKELNEKAEAHRKSLYKQDLTDEEKQLKRKVLAKKAAQQVQNALATRSDRMKAVVKLDAYQEQKASDLRKLLIPELEQARGFASLPAMEIVDEIKNDIKEAKEAKAEKRMDTALSQVSKLFAVAPAPATGLLKKAEGVLQSLPLIGSAYNWVTGRG